MLLLMMLSANLLVLVVDDDPSLRDLIEWGLSDLGYRVATAENGAAALQAVRQEMPCVILLDMRMPIMDGWTFARQYRRLPGPHAPIVVVTAARDAAERAGEVNAAGYLAKPFELDELIRTVERYSAGSNPPQ
jgi:CheY-like chemotaxis protein